MTDTLRIWDATPSKKSKSRACDIAEAYSSLGDAQYLLAQDLEKDIDVAEVMQKYEKSASNYDKAISIWNELQENNVLLDLEDQCAIASTLGGLGMIKIALARISQSEEILSEAKIKIHMAQEKYEQYKPDHPNHPVMFGCLGRIYDMYGDNPSSLKYYQQAVRLVYNRNGISEQFSNYCINYANSILSVEDIEKQMELFAELITTYNLNSLEENHPLHRIVPTFVEMSKICAQIEFEDKNLNEAIRILEIVDKLYPSRFEIYQNLGCYYYVLAASNKQLEGSDFYQANIITAELNFKKSFSVNNNVNTNTKYANFLYQNQRYNEAIIYLQQAINNPASTRGLSYGQMEKVTLSEDLQKEIEFFDEIAITHPLVFAYYLLVKAQNLLGNVDQANELVEQFKNYIVDNKDALTYSLLGYSYKALERFEEAISAFEQAASLYQATDERLEYDLATENQAICLSLISSSTTTGLNENNTIQKGIEKNEIWYMKPVYNNPMLNNQNLEEILETAYQYGGIELTNKIINLGQNSEFYKNFVESIKRNGIESTIVKEASDSRFALFINLESKTPPFSTNSINNQFTDQAGFLPNSDFTQDGFADQTSPESNYKNLPNIQAVTATSFVIKEMIEIAPTLKYFAKEVLGMQYVMPKKLQEINLPEFTKQNYFWVAMHYAAGTIGAFTLPTTNIALTIKIAAPVASTAIYGARLSIYDTLAQQKQIVIQNGENKPINSPSEFIEKCSFDITAYSVLSLVNSGINKVMLGMPLSIVAYDMLISAAFGGIQCYSAYQQTNHKENHLPKTISESILPSIADAMVLYTTAKNMNFDFSSVFTSMISIKQVLTAISSVVITDQITKLLFSSNREFLNNLEQGLEEKAYSTVDKFITKVLGEGSTYLNEGNE